MTKGIPPQTKRKGERNRERGVKKGSVKIYMYQIFFIDFIVNPDQIGLMSDMLSE